MHFVARCAQTSRRPADLRSADHRHLRTRHPRAARHVPQRLTRIVLRLRKLLKEISASGPHKLAQMLGIQERAMLFGINVDPGGAE